MMKNVRAKMSMVIYGMSIFGAGFVLGQVVPDWFKAGMAGLFLALAVLVVIGVCIYKIKSK